MLEKIELWKRSWVCWVCVCNINCYFNVFMSFSAIFYIYIYISTKYTLGTFRKSETSLKMQRILYKVEGLIQITF